MSGIMRGKAQELATVISGWPGVEAVVLAGSLAAGTEDRHSDIDLYVYKTSLPHANLRESFAKGIAEGYEIGNTFWETEDLVVLHGGTKVELIWRDLSFPQSELDRILMRHEARVGYSTCIWHNLLHSEILEDVGGGYAALQKRAQQPYPEQLALNIYRKNKPLLAGSLSSYARQTELAETRQDRVSVNHRTAAFLASWFDIVFAANKMPHPGEKKLVDILKSIGARMPPDWEEDLHDLLGGDVPASTVMYRMDKKMNLSYFERILLQ